MAALEINPWFRYYVLRDGRNSALREALAVGREEMTTPQGKCDTCGGPRWFRPLVGAAQCYTCQPGTHDFDGSRRMAKAKHPGHEVSNPAAFGWEWPGENGRRYQIVVLRGITATPVFAATDPSGNWVNVKMADTWACDGTRKGFLALIERWFAEAFAATD